MKFSVWLVSMKRASCSKESKQLAAVTTRFTNGLLLVGFERYTNCRLTFVASPPSLALKWKKMSLTSPQRPPWQKRSITVVESKQE